MFLCVCIVCTLLRAYVGVRTVCVVLRVVTPHNLGVKENSVFPQGFRKRATQQHSEDPLPLINLHISL